MKPLDRKVADAQNEVMFTSEVNFATFFGARQFRNSYCYYYYYSGSSSSIKVLAG